MSDITYSILANFSQGAFMEIVTKYSFVKWFFFIKKEDDTVSISNSCVCVCVYVCICVCTYACLCVCVCVFSSSLPPPVLSHSSHLCHGSPFLVLLPVFLWIPASISCSFFLSLASHSLSP